MKDIKININNQEVQVFPKSKKEMANTPTIDEQKKEFDKLELMGLTDVAEFLGWPKSKVGSYRGQKIKDFPDPIGEIGGRPVWTKKQIKAWRKATGY